MSEHHNGRLEGKVAIVSGSGKGIGEAIARLFASEGAKVVVNARTEVDVQGVVDAIAKAGGDAYGVSADIGTLDGVETLVAGAVEHYQQIDILVHNAGFFPYDPIEKMADDSWRKVLDVNLSSAFRLSKACHPYMRERGGGRILFTSSIQGNRSAVPGCAHYAASKAGLNGFIKSAAVEFATDNITVNGVEPGLTLTAGIQAAISAARRERMAHTVPLDRWGTPGEVASAMLYLASDEAAYITGQTIVMDGGASLTVFKT